MKDLLADEDIEDKEAEEYFYLRKHYVHVSDAQPQVPIIIDLPFFLRFAHGSILVQIDFQHSQAQPYSICTRAIYLT